MKASAAVGLILLSAATLLLLPIKPTHAERTLGRLFAFASLLLGVASLLQVAGMNLGQDAIAGSRLGLPAAIAFTTSALALLCIERRSQADYRPAEALAGIALIAGLFPLMGYLYGAPQLYRVDSWSSTALHMALGITLLAVAILFSRPDQGLMRFMSEPGTSGSIVRRLVLPIVLFPLLVGWVQVRVLNADAVAYQFAAVLGTFLIVTVLLSLVVGFGKRLGVAERDRDEADELVRQTKERLSMALVGAQAGAWDWDISKDVISWSQECDVLFGLNRELPATYADWLACIDPEDRAEVAQAIEHSMKSGEELDAQFRMLRNNSDIRWFECIGRLSRDADGHPDRFTGITRDITRDKLNELQVRRTTQRLELLYNTIIGVLSTEDAQQAARTLCERVLTHLDCDVFLNYIISEENHDFLKLYSWAGISDEQAATWSLMSIDSIISGSVVRDGTRIVVEDVPSQPENPRIHIIRDLGLLSYTCHPLIADGHVIGTIGFGSRSVRRCTLETLALMQAVANHVALAIQRSRASHELTQARAMKEQWLSMLSHALRMPLTPILVSAQMLEEDPASQGHVRENISMIRRNAQLAGNLIDDLLDMTRIHCGQLTLSLEPARLHEMILAAVESCRQETRDKKLVVMTDLTAKNDWIQADIARMQQAVRTIVGSAVKSAQAGGKLVLDTSNEHHGRIAIRIKDAHAGFSADALSRIIEPAQSTQLLDDKQAGMMLGLSVSRGIVELHGGTISASIPSAEAGTMLEISFPLTRALPQVASSRPISVSPIGHSVLVVDDHGDTSRALRQLLTYLGNEVQCAGSVADALKLAQTHVFDLLISDIALPDGTGIDLLKKLYEIQPMRAIAISGHVMEEDSRRSLNAGFHAHLTKPVSIEKLKMAMADALSEQQQPSELPAT